MQHTSHYGIISRLQKHGYLILLIVAYILLICGLLFAWNTPCTGYEANIYAETPLIFWIGLFACYLVGIGITLISTFYKKLPRHIAVASYLALILAFVSLLFLTAVRGYKIIGMTSDVGAHIGNLATVVSSGTLINTYYPNIYLETGMFQILTGMDINTVLSLFPMMMIGVFTAEVYLVAKRIFPNKGERYFVLLVSLFIPIGSFTLLGSLTLPFAGMTISKFGLLSLFAFTILGTISDSRKKVIWTLISLILIISIAFYHPHVAVMCGAISAGVFGYSFLSHFGNHRISIRTVIITMGLFLSSLVAFLIAQAERFSSLITSGFKSIFSLLTDDTDIAPSDSSSVQSPAVSDPGVTTPSVQPPIVPDSSVTTPSVQPPAVSELDITTSASSTTDILKMIADSDLLNSLSNTGLSPAVSLFKSAVSYGYGLDTVLEVASINIFIYGMILVAVFLLLKNYWKSESYSLFKVLFFCVCIVGAIMVVSMLGDFSGGYRRFLNPIYVLALLSTGFVLYHFLSKITNQFTKVTLSKILVMFAILAVICFASVLTFHPSPNTLNVGYQTTQSEFTAAETLLPRIDYNNQITTGISNLGATLHRYVHAIYGFNNIIGSYAGGEYHLERTSRTTTNRDNLVPYHFGYDKGFLSLGDSYSEGDYIFIEDRDWISYKLYYPDLMSSRWSMTDFNHLEYDNGLVSTYDNGEVDMYIVSKITS